MRDVAGIGSVVVDHLVTLPRLPHSDEKQEADGLRWQVGGPVPTALVVLSRWGKQCQFQGRWGGDPLGSLIEDDLISEQITLRSSAASAGESGWAHVWLDQQTGTRTTAYHRGSCSPLTPLDIDPADYRGCRVLHLDGCYPEAAMAAARIVHAEGGTVFLDSGSVKPGLEELLGHVDVFNCSQRMIRDFCGTEDATLAGRRFLRYGVRYVTVTAGNRGVVFVSDDQTLYEPAVPIEVVDSNGAGDVFCGALIYGWLERFEWSDTLRLASAAAAWKCTHLGNRVLPTLAQIFAWIDDAEIAAAAPHLDGCYDHCSRDGTE